MKKQVNASWTMDAVVREAWHKVNGMKGRFFVAALITIAIGLIIGFLVKELQLIGATPLPPGSKGVLNNAFIIENWGGTYVKASETMLFVSLLFNIIASIFIDFPLKAGIVLLGLRRAAGKRIRVRDIFRFFKLRYIGRFALLIIIYIVLFALLFFIGMMLYNVALMHVGRAAAVIVAIIATLVALYFIVGVYFSLSIIVDQNIGAWRAVLQSYSVVALAWPRVFVLILFTLVINLIGVIPLGIGLIWTLPLSVNINGILYRELFGLHFKDPVSLAESNVEPT